MSTPVQGSRLLTPQLLTPERFAPYGDVILPAEDGDVYKPGKDADLDLSQGRPRFYIMTLHSRGLSFDRITRHRQTTQCLGSLEGKVWYLAVAEPKDLEDPEAVPDLETLQAFYIPGDRALKLHRGTWHAGPYFKEESVSFYNLELADTNATDHQTCVLSSRFGLSFEMAAFAG
ncbi:ureidoglycolate lyase [Leptolyngbya sp. FACHB-261]|uniref:ureidoglycolate lyase n=1 Tax=Leptolyngbya sp. FACHB-261 TaxID=2692806 RepID=UPI0016879494|nr:ureidoglycolate lyase [Leptolyngbya sp. FACHB-261]MBD2101244.1 ureidoglycolate lyase [Leptolyngbya sp. FACHB-261]